MLMMFLAGLASAADAPARAAAPAVPAPAPAATPAGRGVRDLPSTTITYYDVQGRNGPAIKKSLAKVLADPATKDNVRLYNWDVGVMLTKRITGPVCVVQGAKSTMSATVRLPRLVEQAKVDKNVAASWATYLGSVEGKAAGDLWFIRDHLPAVEQSMAGIPCDQAAAKWNAGIADVKAQLAAFSAQRAAAAAAAATAAAQLPQN